MLSSISITLYSCSRISSKCFPSLSFKEKKILIFSSSSIINLKPMKLRAFHYFFIIIAVIFIIHVPLWFMIDLGENEEEDGNNDNNNKDSATMTIHKQVHKHSHHDHHQETRKSSDETPSPISSSSTSSSSSSLTSKVSNKKTNKTHHQDYDYFRPLSIDPRSWISFHSSILRKVKRALTTNNNKENQNDYMMMLFLSPRQWIRASPANEDSIINQEDNENKMIRIVEVKKENKNSDEGIKSQKHRKRKPSSSLSIDERDKLESEKDIAQLFWQRPLLDGDQQQNIEMNIVFPKNDDENMMKSSLSASSKEKRLELFSSEAREKNDLIVFCISGQRSLNVVKNILPKIRTSNQRITSNNVLLLIPGCALSSSSKKRKSNTALCRSIREIERQTLALVESSRSTTTLSSMMNNISITVLKVTPTFFAAVNVWSLLPLLVISSSSSLTSSSSSKTDITNHQKLVFFGPGLAGIHSKEDDSLLVVDEMLSSLSSTSSSFVGCSPITFADDDEDSSSSSYHLGQGIEVHQGKHAQLWLDERMAGFSSKDRRTVITSLDDSSNNTRKIDGISDIGDGIPLATVSPFCFATQFENIIEFWPSSSSSVKDLHQHQHQNHQDAKNVIQKYQNYERVGISPDGRKLEISLLPSSLSSSSSSHQKNRNDNNNNNMNDDDFFVNFKVHGEILITMMNTAGFHYWSAPTTSPSMTTLFHQVSFFPPENWSPIYENTLEAQKTGGGFVALTNEKGSFHQHNTPMMMMRRLSSSSVLNHPALARLFHLSKLPISWWPESAQTFFKRVIINSNDVLERSDASTTTPLQPAIIWETFCVPCFGFTNEVMHFVWPLENRIPIRVRHGLDCFCSGTPKAMTRSLYRLGQPKAFEARAPTRPLPSSLQKRIITTDNDENKNRVEEQEEDASSLSFSRKHKKLSLIEEKIKRRRSNAFKARKWIKKSNKKSDGSSSSKPVKTKIGENDERGPTKSKNKSFFAKNRLSSSSSSSSLFDAATTKGNSGLPFYIDKQTTNNNNNNDGVDDDSFSSFIAESMMYNPNNNNKRDDHDNNDQKENGNEKDTTPSKQKSNKFKRQDDHFIVLILHKDPGSLPDSLWATMTDGLYRTPDMIIARSMYEFTKVPANWRHKDRIAKEVWVPSRFVRWVFEHQDEIHQGMKNNKNSIVDRLFSDDDNNGENAEKKDSSFFDKSKLVVVGEPIDVYQYDPDVVKPLKLPIHSSLNWKHASTATDQNPHHQQLSSQTPLSSNYKFFSSFKWENRKGWKILLRAYFTEFFHDRKVSLYISSYLYGDDSRNPERLMDFVKEVALEVIKEKKQELNNNAQEEKQTSNNNLHRHQKREITSPVLKRNYFPSRGRFSSSSSDHDYDDNDRNHQIQEQNILIEEDNNNDEQDDNTNDDDVSSLWKSKIPHVEIISERISEQKMVELYRSVDAFVLPTRGEGWGLPVIQAMSMGLPVISTNWSGAVDFMMSSDTEIIHHHHRRRRTTEEDSSSSSSSLKKSNNNKPLKFSQGEICYPIRLEKLEPAVQNPGDEPEEGKEWAVPSLSHLKKLMRRVYTFRDEAKERGAKARSFIVSQFSDEAVAELVARRVEYLMEKEVSD